MSVSKYTLVVRLTEVDIGIKEDYSSQIIQDVQQRQSLDQVFKKNAFYFFFYTFKKHIFKAQRFTLYINTSLLLTKKMVAFAHCALIAKSLQLIWVSCGVTSPVNILLHKSHLT